MGAQIAAHLVNAGVDTVLFDLPAKEGDPDGVVTKAIAAKGNFEASMAQDFTAIGAATADAVARVMGGETIREPMIYVPTRLITAANVNE